MPDWIIRPFNIEDLGAIVKVQNVCAPVHKVGLGEMQRDMETLAPELQRIIFVAASGQEIIGFCSAQRQAGTYHPRKFMLELGVSLDFRRKGIGSALYDAMTSHLQPFSVISLSVQVAESDVGSVKFATDRGFAEQKRDFVSELSVPSFDMSLFVESKAKMAEQGVEIRCFDELDSPDFRRTWYDLFCEVRQDVPRSEPPTPITFEFFDEQVINEPDLARTATLFAFKDGQCIGFTGGFHDKDNSLLDQWLTAVKREYRGLGVAFALKTFQIAATKELGIATIKTDNDARNAPMLAINGRLGFIRQPAVLSMRKDY